MYKFSTDSIDIVRKKGDAYIQESITTKTILPGNENDEANRKKVIGRLREDPSVFMVLDPKNGHCHEQARHNSGFSFTVTIDEGENPTASLKVLYKDTTAYEEDFPAEGRTPDDFFDPVWEVLSRVTEILEDIEDENYEFVLDSCPFFSRRESGEPVELFDAGLLLMDEGYQTERLSSIKDINEPILFVHENDVVLLGHNFADEGLYLEMKRFFHGVNEKTVDEAIRKVVESDPSARAIKREDGSWSFRIMLDPAADKENFIRLMKADLNALLSFVGKIEDQDGVGKEPWDITQEQRHYFIYETLDTSLKLSKLLV